MQRAFVLQKKAIGLVAGLNKLQTCIKAFKVLTIIMRLVLNNLKEIKLGSKSKF